MISHDNIIAVVVWFNPTEQQSRHIASYSHAVRQVIVVDNSAEDHRAWLEAYDNCHYLSLGSNQGIACALNAGCQLAVRQGAQWILTMDQDSQWDESELTNYIRYANAYDQLPDVGVFSPRQDYASHRKHYPDRYEQKIAVMTSGNLISVVGYEATGGFRDEFFIDEVDNEYCMHIRQVGMQVVVINDAFLEHQLGELKTIRFLGIWKKEYIDHAPFRYYYMTRNNLALSELYPQYRAFNTKRLKKMLKRILLYDWDHKCLALKYCRDGWIDYRKHQFGKLCCDLSAR